MCLTIMLCVLCFIFIPQIHQGLCPSTLMENGLMNQLHPIYGIFCGLWSMEVLVVRLSSVCGVYDGGEQDLLMPVPV